VFLGVAGVPAKELEGVPEELGVFSETLAYLLCELFVVEIAVVAGLSGNRGHQVGKPEVR